MNNTNSLPRIIMVTGEGKVNAQPDVATVSFSIISQGKKVKSVMDDGKERMNKVLDLLKELKIDSKDIATSAYYFSPDYAYPRNKPPQIIGYRLEQQITVKIRELSFIDRVLDLTVEAGINKVGQLNFLIDEEGNLKKEARKKAFEDASEKARFLSEAAQVKLGRIVTFSEGNSILNPEIFYEQFYQSPPRSKSFGGFLSDSSSAQSASQVSTIATGNKEVRIVVQVVYEIE